MRSFVLIAALALAAEARACPMVTGSDGELRPSLNCPTVFRVEDGEQGEHLLLCNPVEPYPVGATERDSRALACLGYPDDALLRIPAGADPREFLQGHVATPADHVPAD